MGVVNHHSNTPTSSTESRLSNSLLSNLKTILGPIGVILSFYALALLLLSTIRLMLVIWQGDRTLDDGVWSQIIFNGLRIDISGLSYLFIIPLLVTVITLFFNSCLLYTSPSPRD